MQSTTLLADQDEKKEQSKQQNLHWHTPRFEVLGNGPVSRNPPARCTFPQDLHRYYYTENYAEVASGG